jgi:hypothetical protein
MLIVDVSEVKLSGEAKQNKLAPECGQLIDGLMLHCLIEIFMLCPVDKCRHPITKITKPSICGCSDKE